jgi:hypothetical protein
VFYIYGEPGRLARAVLYAYTRGLLEDSTWVQWFERVSSPAPLETLNESFFIKAGLAHRHNTLAFLQVMHLNAGSVEGGEGERLDDLVVQAITRVSGG